MITPRLLEAWRRDTASTVAAFDAGAGFRRNGTSFEAKCPRCGENTKMATGATESHVMLFAVQCGACMAIFEGEDADAVRGIPIAATSSTMSP